MSDDARPPITGMTLRLELFVDDLDASIAFYGDLLGFSTDRREEDYAALRNGDAVLGLGLAGNLPASHHFNRESLSGPRGTGAEIVLEVADVDACYRRVVESRHPVAATLRTRPWGARDFRIVDPDGYYLRITSRAE